MPVVIEAVGTVQSIASIQIKSRLDSQIMKVNVEEGALVKEGDLLFELDARTLRRSSPRSKPRSARTRRRSTRPSATPSAPAAC